MMMMNTQEVEEMDKWETIIDWTAEETMLGKTFTTDDNGEPFELKKVSIFVAVAPPEDSSITTSMDFNVSLTSQTSTFAALLGGAPKYGEKNHYGHVLFMPTPYGLYPIIQTYSVNNTNVNNNLQNKYNSLGFNVVGDDGLIKPTPETCTIVSVGSHYQKCLFKGTRVLVKGVRI